MKYSHKTLLKSIALIYDAGADSGHWESLLQSLAKILRAEQASFYLRDSIHGHRSVRASIGIDASFLRSYEEHYAAKNAFMIQGKARLRVGNVCASEWLCPDNILFKTEFYNDWCSPQRTHRGINALIAKDNSLMSVLVFIRKSTARSPDREDLAFVQTLMPHLQRAAQFHRRIADLEATKTAMGETLEGWPVGIIILDRSGRSIFRNTAAERILSRGDGLAVRPDGFRANLPGETNGLRALIAEGIRTGNGKGDHAGGVIALRREKAEQPLTVQVMPVSVRQSLISGGEAACVLFVHDPSSKILSDREALRRAYQLTLTELKIVQLLADGRDIAQICEELTIKKNTARTHLRRIFEKTSVRRQAELVRLVLTSPFTLPNR